MTATEVPHEEPELEIDPYERNWMRLSILLLMVFFAAVSIAGFSLGFQVSGADQEVDPRTVLDSAPWSEPGLREIGPNEFEAYVVAKTWAFEPNTLEVPVGSTVKIFVTSPDLQHGFKITDTNINMQVVPGQVSALEYTFDSVGEYPILCHEYCGRGHATMFGTMSVVAQGAAEGGEGQGSEGQEGEGE